MLLSSLASALRQLAFDRLLTAEGMVGIIMLPSTIVVAVFAVAHAERLNTPSSFMLVGGVSARSEMCLTGLENIGASLSCHAAVAELDGREIWSLQCRQRSVWLFQVVR